MTCTDAPSRAAYDNLVQLAAALRPRWQTPGIKAAVRKALERDASFTFADLAYAVAYLCADKTIETPAPLAHDGPWWPKPSTMPTTLAAPWDDRCAVCSYPERTCRRLYDGEDHLYTPNTQRRPGVQTPAELDTAARAAIAEARRETKRIEAERRAKQSTTPTDNQETP